jgi:hypothetical protein
MCMGQQDVSASSEDGETLGTGICLYGRSVGATWNGLVYWSNGDFERWLKWALDLGHLSLWELCEGNLEGGLRCWGPWSIGRKGSGDGLLFP